MVGLPWDVTSSYRRGASEAPDAIRRATSGRLYNWFTERGVDLSAKLKVCDHGNVRWTKDLFSLDERLLRAILLHNHDAPFTLFLGGDHFVSYPCFASTAKTRGQHLSLLYFDAHPDLYQDYEGTLYSHATTVSRILEKSDLSSGRVCYVGVRASTRDQNERIKRFGLTVHTTQDVYAKGCHAISSSVRSLLKDGPVYLSIDLDSLDPAFAPGVANPQPGGLSTRQMLEILEGLEGLQIVAADLVEYSPRFDAPAGITGFTCAILIKEVMGLMSASPTAENRSP